MSSLQYIYKHHLQLLCLSDLPVCGEVVQLQTLTHHKFSVDSDFFVCVDSFGLDLRAEHNLGEYNQVSSEVGTEMEVIILKKKLIKREIVGGCKDYSGFGRRSNGWVYRINTARRRELLYGYHGSRYRA